MVSPLHQPPSFLHPWFLLPRGVSTGVASTGHFPRPTWHPLWVWLCANWLTTSKDSVPPSEEDPDWLASLLEPGPGAQVAEITGRASFRCLPLLVSGGLGMEQAQHALPRQDVANADVHRTQAGCVGEQMSLGERQAHICTLGTGQR